MRLVSLHFVLTFEKGAQISVNFVLYTKPDSDLRVWKKFCSNIWKKVVKMRLVSFICPQYISICLSFNLTDQLFIQFFLLVDEVTKKKMFSFCKATHYSKLSIIRAGRSRLREFEKKDWSFYRDFFQIPRPGCLIEPKNWPWHP